MATPSPVAPDDRFGMLDAVAYYAGVQPKRRAVLDFGTGLDLTWEGFDQRIDRCAAAMEAMLAAAVARPYHPRPNRADKPSTLLYTSGTTGRPKGVIVTERGAFASTLNFSLSTRLNANSVAYCDMPLFHVAGLMSGARA